MLRALGFRRQETLSQDEATPLILQQAHDFELALQSMDYLLDDRTKEGLHLIEDDPNCTIKVLANGVIKFLEATLGFEPEVMKKAGEILTKAETLSHRDRSKYQKMKLKTSANFPPGTEYAVTYAEANLLNALIMLLSESMIESAKALYKLRKAYHTLDEVFVLIREYEARQKLQKQKEGDLNNIPNQSSSTINSDTSSVFADIPFSLSTEQLKDTKITGFAENIQRMRSLRLNGAHIGNTPATDRLRSELGYNKEASETVDSDSNSTAEQRAIDESQSTVDEFIISGANLCFGILQLVLSLIPPAIGKVLSVVGFRGSRENGLKMIWKSVEGRNVHGCIGLLALLVFYDGPFQFTDADFDIPDLSRTKSTTSTTHSEQKLSLQKTLSQKRMRSESFAFQGVGKPTLLHPGKKLEDALLYARALFPHSALWLLQESRMLASRGRLEEALDLMDSLDRKIEMRQVEALLVFDRTMILIFLHKYERAAQDLKTLVDINGWSPGLYTYCAGCCYLELYRMCKMGIITDKEELKREGYFRKKAEQLILEAPQYSRSGKINGKQMPFDKFLIRKITQFEQTAQTYKVDFIDAIGTSPVHELAYFWNGYNRMPEEHLQIATKLLDYSVSEHAKVPEIQNQSMIRNLLQSITLRRLGEFSKGDELIDKKVLKYIIELDDPREPDYRFIRHTDDPWLYPTALYEKALFVWKESGINGLEESKEWLKRAQAYSDDYELSTRVSMKIKAALDRLEDL